MKIGRNDPCWCGSGRKYKQCHEAFDRKMEHYAHLGHIVPTHDMLKTPEQIAEIRKSADLNTAVLDHVAAHIKAGMSTAQIDKLVYDFTTEHGEFRHRLDMKDFQRVCAPLSTV